MRIAKYPFAVLSAALFTVMLMTPISSLSNLIWLASVDMPVGLISSLEVILFDFQRLKLPKKLPVIAEEGYFNTHEPESAIKA